MIAIALVVLGAIALSFATWPLWRKGAQGRDRRLDVYRQQLAEIDQELESGLLTPEAAAAARLEVERRLLRAADALENAAPAAADGTRALPFIILSVAAVAGAVALYLALGRPDLGGSPHRDPGLERIAAGEGEVSLHELVDKLIAHLDQNPEAMEGWQHLRRAAPALNREGDWAAALARAVATRPDNFELRVYYLESLIALGRGQITPAAELALRQAMEMDGRAPVLRYYQGLALMQKGKAAEAEEVWQALLADAPPEAEWRDQIIRRISEARQAQGKPPVANAAAEAIMNLPPEEQAAQIRAMVENLAARLEDEPDNGPGWLRLARAYRVMGEGDKALQAYGRALDIAERQGDQAAVNSIRAEMQADGS